MSTIPSRVTLTLVLALAAGWSGRAIVQEAPVPFPGEMVSSEEIRRTLEGIDYDRTSGRPGERRAAEFLASRLDAWGVEHTTHEVHAYLSWPGRAELTLADGSASFAAVTPAFGGSTPAGGLRGDLWWLPDGDDGPLPAEAMGRIVVAQGLVSPDSVRRAELGGAAGLVHVNSADILHETVATTVWGAPTTKSASRVPTLPVVSISRSDGERLRRAAADGRRRVRLVTEVTTGWVDIPLVVADVSGETPRFVLVATHLDAWYAGMTDTGGTVASILEMARVLQTHKDDLKRGVRFAWWPGHSYGRYAGSAWYADHAWADLDAHAIAYTNLDGAGRRGSQMDAVYARGWPGLDAYSRQFVATALRKSVPSPPSARLFRPGRDSDSAFQGIGIPEFAVGVPGPPRGHPDTSSGRVNYWHTAQDTLDKIDLEALTLDTRYRVAQVYDLATRAVLPHQLAPIADSYVRAIEDLAVAAGPRFDLSPVRAAATRLRELAKRFDATAVQATPEVGSGRDALVVRLTHRLNSTLYTKSGRFDQDPAAELPILPLLDRVRTLRTLDPTADLYGFLQVELVRGRNEVLWTLTAAAEALEAFLAGVG